MFKLFKTKEDTITHDEPIFFAGRNYSTRMVEIKNFGKALVAGDRLLDVLVTDDGKFASHDAMNIMCKVTAFVDDKFITSVNDEKLARIVAKEVA